MAPNDDINFNKYALRRLRFKLVNIIRALLDSQKMRSAKVSLRGSEDLKSVISETVDDLIAKYHGKRHHLTGGTLEICWKELPHWTNMKLPPALVIYRSSDW